MNKQLSNFFAVIVACSSIIVEVSTWDGIEYHEDHEIDCPFLRSCMCKDTAHKYPYNDQAYALLRQVEKYGENS